MKTYAIALIGILVGACTSDDGSASTSDDGGADDTGGDDTGGDDTGTGGDDTPTDDAPDGGDPKDPMDGSTPEPGPDGGGADGGMVTPGGPDSSDGCKTPMGATVLAGWRKFQAEGGPAYSIGADATDIYVAFLDTVVQVPKNGGAAQTVYTAQNPLGLSLHTYGDSGFLIRDGNAWLDLEGGNTTPAVFPPTWLPGTQIVTSVSQVFVKDKDTIWIRHDNFLDSVSGYSLLKRGEAEPLVIAQDTTVGFGGFMVTAPGFDQLLTNTAPIRPETAGWDSFQLFAETAGAASPLAVTPGGMPFLVTASSIYYNRSDDAPLAEHGAWRVPRAGGTGVKLAGGTGRFFGANDGTRVALHNLGSLWVNTDAAGSTTLTKLLDLPIRNTIDNSCTSHAVAVDGREVFSTMFSEKSDESLIFKVRAPE